MTNREMERAIFLIKGTHFMMGTLGVLFCLVFGVVGFMVGGILMGLMSFIPFAFAVVYMTVEHLIDEVYDLRKRWEA